MDCIFCKIVNGEIPAVKILEDGLHLAFLDIRPCSPGHTLAITKKHYEKLEDMPEEEAKKYFGFIHKLIKAIPRAVNANGFNLGINNGRVAGQEVMHVHFNIIPRFEGDKGLPVQGLVHIEVKEDLNIIAEKIKTELSKIVVEKKEETLKKCEEKEGEEKPRKSFEREWQEFNLKHQDDVEDLSEVRRE
jgi:histidine triad (HIT) family protein